MSVAATSEVAVARPDEIHKNPENPRLVFHEKDLFDLEQSIAANGILVPLTVYKDDQGRLILLDGERRWRCAKKLGLPRVPIIVQPQPTLIQNIMMMFAIHNARSDWEPLPTALKLKQLEDLYERNEGKRPTETQLAQLASLSRGEVRRLKNILGLPEVYLELIEAEQDLPKQEQSLTVDHLLEVTRGASALQRQGVLEGEQETARLERVLIEKFRSDVLRSTVEPRLLTRMARAVERHDVPREAVEAAVARLVNEPEFTVSDAFEVSVRRAEEEHNLEMSATRLAASLEQLSQVGELSQQTVLSLRSLKSLLDRLLRE